MVGVFPLFYLGNFRYLINLDIIWLYLHGNCSFIIHSFIYIIYRCKAEKQIFFSDFKTALTFACKLGFVHLKSFYRETSSARLYSFFTFIVYDGITTFVTLPNKFRNEIKEGVLLYSYYNA